MASSEKRTFVRYRRWFPVTLLVEDGGSTREVWAICRDASAGGLLVSSVLPLPVGTGLLARFRVAPNIEHDRVVDAEIVRTAANEDELMLAFPFRLGIRFRAPVTELLGELSDSLGSIPPLEPTDTTETET